MRRMGQQALEAVTAEPTLLEPVSEWYHGPTAVAEANAQARITFQHAGPNQMHGSQAGVDRKGGERHQIGKVLQALDPDRMQGVDEDRQTQAFAFSVEGFKAGIARKHPIDVATDLDAPEAIGLEAREFAGRHFDILQGQHAETVEARRRARHHLGDLMIHIARK